MPYFNQFVPHVFGCKVPGFQKLCRFPIFFDSFFCIWNGTFQSLFPHHSGGISPPLAFTTRPSLFRNAKHDVRLWFWLNRFHSLVNDRLSASNVLCFLAQALVFEISHRRDSSGFKSGGYSGPNYSEISPFSTSLLARDFCGCAESRWNVQCSEPNYCMPSVANKTPAYLPDRFAGSSWLQRKEKSEERPFLETSGKTEICWTPRCRVTLNSLIYPQNSPF